jgi:hypothetical protein
MSGLLVPANKQRNGMSGLWVSSQHQKFRSAFPASAGGRVPPSLSLSLSMSPRRRCDRWAEGLSGLCSPREGDYPSWLWKSSHSWHAEPSLTRARPGPSSVASAADDGSTSCQLDGRLLVREVRDGSGLCIRVGWGGVMNKCARM